METPRATLPDHRQSHRDRVTVRSPFAWRLDAGIRGRVFELVEPPREDEPLVVAVLVAFDRAAVLESAKVVLGLAGPELEIVPNLREVCAGCRRQIADDRIPRVALTRLGRRRFGETSERGTGADGCESAEGRPLVVVDPVASSYLPTARKETVGKTGFAPLRSLKPESRCILGVRPDGSGRITRPPSSIISSGSAVDAVRSLRDRLGFPFDRLDVHLVLLDLTDDLGDVV